MRIRQARRRGRHTRGSRQPRTSRRRLAATASVAGLLLTAGCAGAGAVGGSAPGTTLTVAIVANPQMADVEQLTPYFEHQHPGVHIKYVTLPENEARQKITESVATGSHEFDVVMISNYETPMWAKDSWLVDLQPYADRTPGYDPGDFIGPIRQSLSYRGDMYSVPFYGESSFLMYRKDLFAAHHLTMPAHPTWDQVAPLADKLNDPAHHIAGICLRGDPGWGENLAPLDTVVNTFGGRWFDQRWNAQLTSPAVEKAVSFYTGLLHRAGEPAASSAGFTECGTDMAQGNAAMWYDATVAAGSLEDPASSKVVGKIGYAPAPVEKTNSSGWLYSWSLGIPKTSGHKDAAWQFVSWATSKSYIKLVGEKLGWSRVPPGSRASTYQIPQYQKAAAAFAGPTVQAISSADPVHPTVDPVPDTGVQFLGIPEFEDLGTRVSQQITAAIARQKSVHDALAQSQQYARTVGRSYQHP
ncbi:ABC transporter substrate-binding protein [Streptantibioticus rubrisoli]|uniref:Sugar ABC transporter substrate-binding protein n=1 Tax=Streptantibioticus rubrisoli TaxID=1387313 RepID=A0ABT1P5A7_9ACTN|nr:sugar ABC transporter substrate-binding protein [Streptantibioticus rubrisoli]MCQ4040557.1 sugar ABC transporter substrate-binding protein [Streptantibioticus rubrisoli]